MCRVEGKIWDRLESHITDVLDNTFIDRATWSLPILEKEFKIPTDVSKTNEQRRSMIKAKKRGSGPFTIRLIHSIADAFRQGTATVELLKGESTFMISFVDGNRTTMDLRDAHKQLRRTIPAHKTFELGIERNQAITLDDDYDKLMYPFEFYAGDTVADGVHIANGNAAYAASAETAAAYTQVPQPYQVVHELFYLGNNRNAEYKATVEATAAYAATLQAYPICGDYITREGY